MTKETESARHGLVFYTNKVCNMHKFLVKDTSMDAVLVGESCHYRNVICGECL